MKKTLTINLAGYVFNIDEDAYYLLDNYIQNLRNYFRKGNDADEIVHDMEQRISELFTDKLKSNSREVITVNDVEDVIAILGKPEQMSSDDESFSSDSYSNTASENKRLFRNEDDMVLGGVCSGVAAYFGWDVTNFRVLIILFGFFVHGTLIAYIIAWIIIPPAKTASEKLSMQGKTINVENIGKAVTDGFDRVKSKIESEDTRTTLQKIGDAFVSVVGTLIKILLIIIGVCLAPAIFLIVIVLFVLIFVSIGLVSATPAMLSGLDYYIPMFNWNTIGSSPFEAIIIAISGIVVIGLPIVGLIHMIMRHFFGWQPMSITTRIVFIVCWLIALGVGVFHSLSLPLFGFHYFIL